MDREFKEFLEIEGIKKNLTIKGLIKYILKYIFYSLALVVYYFAIAVNKAKSDAMSLSYGILKPCNKCVWGKKREALIILSGTGYSRDDKVLQVMNYDGCNWTNRGDCIGYTKCAKCIEAINKKVELCCNWKKM